MPYIIRFEGIGSTCVCADNLAEAIEHGEMFERRGMTNIVVSWESGDNVSLGALRKLAKGGGKASAAFPKP